MALKNEILKKLIAITVSCIMIIGIMPLSLFAAQAFSLTVEDISGITYKAANITANVTPADGATITEKGIEYSNSSDFSTSTLISSSNSSDLFSVTLDNLNPGQTYYVRSYAKYYTDSPDIVDTTSSIHKSFTTASLEPISVSISYIDANGSTSPNVKAVISGSSAYTITECGFEYKLGSTTNYAPATPSGTTFEKTLTGLTANSKYTITAYVKAVYNGNTTSATASKDYDTTPAIVLSKPTVTTDSLTLSGTTITARGTVTSNGNSPLTESGFLYSTSTTTPILNGVGVIKIQNGTDTALLKTITASATATSRYYVRAYAINAQGESYGEIKYIDVVISKTVPAVTTTAPTISGYVITFKGTVTSTGNDTLTDSGFVYSTSTTAPVIGGSTTTRISTNKATALSYSFTGAANTTYYVRAYAINSVGTTYGTYQLIKTPTDTTAVPTVLTTSASTYDNTITAKGTVTNTGGLTILESGFVYSATNSSPTVGGTNSSKVSVSSSSTTISNSFTGDAGKYYVRAFARNSKGTGYGITITIETSLPTVYTYDIKNISSNAADIYIDVTSTGGYSISERGVVYSSSTSSPTIGTSKTEDKTIDGTTGRDYATITGLDSNTKYYVRAYAKNSKGTAYGEVKTLTTTTGGTIKTVEVIDITGGGATIIGNISDAQGTITEKGFVYSKSSSPTTSDDLVKTTSSTLGRYSLDITGLSPNTKYYVRAYLKTSKGTTYADSISFKTINSAVAFTNSATSITDSTVVLNGSVSNSSSYSVTEKGFVYSRTNQTPTIDDAKIAHSTKDTGTYSIKLTNLFSDNNYYYRAYVKTSQGTSYGSTIKFTTSDAKVNATINYKTIYGSQIKSQTITASSGAKLTKANLTIPTGYKLYDSNWSYTVDSTTTITVLVSKIENAFMSGVGNNKFAPDQSTTRAEIASAIYSLAIDKTIPVGAKSFTDVSSSNPAKKAIEFCSAKGYMNGYPDGSFRPDGKITRVEVSVVLCNLYNLTGEATSQFTDVSPSYWGYRFISLVSSNGMMNGYPNGTFGFDNTTTRAEATTLLSNAEKRGLEPLGKRDFSDVPKTHWAYKFIMNAAIAE